LTRNILEVLLNDILIQCSISDINEFIKSHRIKLQLSVLITIDSMEQTMNMHMVECEQSDVTEEIAPTAVKAETEEESEASPQ